MTEDRPDYGLQDMWAVVLEEEKEEESRVSSGTRRFTSSQLGSDSQDCVEEDAVGRFGL